MRRGCPGVPEVEKARFGRGSDGFAREDSGGAEEADSVVSGDVRAARGLSVISTSGGGNEWRGVGQRTP